MTSPERYLKRVDETIKSQVSKNSGEIVKIYPDGTACEGQKVPVGSLCRWSGFDKTAGPEGEFYGRPIKSK